MKLQDHQPSLESFCGLLVNRERDVTDTKYQNREEVATVKEESIEKQMNAISNTPEDILRSESLNLHSTCKKVLAKAVVSHLEIRKAALTV